MNKHFVKIGKKLSASLESNLHDKHYMKYLGKRNPFSIILRPTDEYEIIEIIEKLNNNKSMGYIDIPIVLFKEAKLLISRYLAESLYNECLNTGHCPDVFKITNVIPLHKGGFKLALENYRPISILSPINKVFETILRRRMIVFLGKV